MNECEAINNILFTYCAVDKELLYICHSICIYWFDAKVTIRKTPSPIKLNKDG